MMMERKAIGAIWLGLCVIALAAVIAQSNAGIDTALSEEFELRQAPHLNFLLAKVPTKEQVDKELSACKMKICGALSAELKQNDKDWKVEDYKWGNRGAKGVMDELQEFDNYWAQGSWNSDN